MWSTPGPSWLTAFLIQDDGQDLVEYALLAAFLGTAGLAALSALLPTIGGAYRAWIGAAADAWEPQAAAGAGGA